MRVFIVKIKGIASVANIITCIRIVCSVAILFCPALSIPFYVLYLIAGFTDMIDGTVARKMGTVSDFGAKLDSVADFIFVAACLIKLIPLLNFDRCIYIWIVIIALIKVINIASGFVMEQKLVVVHSIMNKVTGGLLFVFPLTISFIEVRYSAIVVCLVATFAAIQEGHFIRTGRVQ
ncbi:MAG: CDP-alcohol phosphatidyltransferase family protein [Clostridiales bacterium]|jgi:CDP-diacylglycerol--glycerol-3-phosphate 3-phosphatidyltransferase|nr:CDP-alcohol phosphatidyltransferase family protein [Clostridiales bacterium]